MKFVKSTEKKKILQQLEKQFGITKLPFLLTKSGKEKIRGFTGDLTRHWDLFGKNRTDTKTKFRRSAHPTRSNQKRNYRNQ